jgi:hypothetical protein
MWVKVYRIERAEKSDITNNPTSIKYPQTPYKSRNFEGIFGEFGIFRTGKHRHTGRPIPAQAPRHGGHGNAAP